MPLIGFFIYKQDGMIKVKQIIIVRWEGHWRKLLTIKDSGNGNKLRIKDFGNWNSSHYFANDVTYSIYRIWLHEDTDGIFGPIDLEINYEFEIQF